MTSSLPVSLGTSTMRGRADSTTEITGCTTLQKQSDSSLHYQSVRVSLSCGETLNKVAVQRSRAKSDQTARSLRLAVVLGSY